MILHTDPEAPFFRDSFYTESINLFLVHLQILFLLLAIWEGESYVNEEFRLHRARRGSLVEVGIYCCRAGQILSGKKPNTKVEEELDCFAIKTRQSTTLCGARGEGSTSVELLTRAIFHRYV